MVSFSCEGCGDVLTKKKLDAHRNQCYGSSFTCIDCMVDFYGLDYRSHTSCMSEAQKYQGALYRPEKEKKGKQNKQNNSKAVVPHKAYVEDADDEFGGHNSHITIVDPPPEAPSPPSAAPGFDMSGGPNVFDFLVDSETPNASRIELPAPEPMAMIEDVPEVQEPESRDLVRVRFEDDQQSISDLVEYGTGPVTSSSFETPAPKGERERRRDRREREQSREDKKDKKRKRLHVDTQDLDARSDEIMTDAPPVLHSGLTGGLNRLLSRPSMFPPSPDYSGDAGEPSPGSPLKKAKNLKRGRSISNNIMSLISGDKGGSSREHSEDRPKRKHRKHREREGSSRPSRKMIEYQPTPNGDRDMDDASQQLVVYKPRAEMLFEFINKGPESERGVSMNKALKRYHRERQAMGISLGKGEEEKELWKSLRMKRNEVGEIVLFL